MTTPEQGLLGERKDYYVTRGYSLNDRVGKSYIEYQYEDYLNAHKEKVEYVENSKGEVVSQKPVDEGSRGYDLQLSLDMELQSKVEKVIEKELRRSRAAGNYMVDRGFAVMMDPNNGDILSMAGNASISKQIKYRILRSEHLRPNMRWALLLKERLFSQVTKVSRIIKRLSMHRLYLKAKRENNRGHKWEPLLS